MSICVTSYNILADAYLNPAWYPNCAPRDFEPTRRRAALLDRIAALGSDVICLQEVEADAFAAIEQRLIGYRGELIQKSGGKPDGCATFVRNERLLRRAEPLHYTDDTGHVALLLSIEVDGRMLGIANTHVRWDPPGTPTETQLGRRQMLQLLDALEREERRCDGWIVCGDLNASPDSDLIAAALERGFLDAYQGQVAYTCNSNRVAKRIDYLLHSPSLGCRTQGVRAIDGKTALPSSEEPSDHLAITGVFDWR